MATGERPLISFDIHELLEYFEEHSDHPASLIALFNELAYRGRKKARELRATALARLSVLWHDGEYFKWPETAAIPGEGGLSATADWPSKGMLKFVGYSTGMSGPSETERRAILDDAFRGPLPHVIDAEYTRSFGKPNSAARLKRLAHSIASFAKNAKRRDAQGMRHAIEHWEGDLEYLWLTYYQGRFDFPWPKVE
jgi:hypothetical protein